jgi:N-acetylglucosaminyldiphosphoundecaprenol N-acetyl-beta-D-mannosaminyltransferase
MTVALPPTREVLGFEVAVTDYEGELESMEAMIAAREPGYFCHAAVSSLMNARRDPAAAGALRDSTLTLPDGMPIVWALRALGEEIPDRVYGPDLMLLACERSAGRHFFYGGKDEAATDLLVDGLRRRFPGMRVAGRWTPPFRPLTVAEEDEIAARIRATAADVVWVGIGSPRQEIWMRRMRDRLEAPVLVGVGAAFDFHAGLVPQAPAWMQKRGLEWLHRLAREPRRLAPRYLRDNPAFLAAVSRQLVRDRRRRRG